MLDLLVRRWRLKLLAVAIAYAVWVAVIGENRAVQDYRVPLDIVTRPDQVLAGEPPTTVNVRLRGPENLLPRVDSLGLGVKVDLSDADPGERGVVLTPAHLRGVPDGVAVDSIEPDRVRLTVARKSRASLPVTPTFTGRPAPGSHYYGFVVKPAEMEAEGPQWRLAAAGRLRTDTIHLDGHSAPFTVRVSAIPEHRDIRIVDPVPVEVEAIVDRPPAERAFDAVPVVFADQEWLAQAVPSRVKVVLSGAPGVLFGLRTDQLRLVADLSGLVPRPTPYSVPVRLEYAGLAPDRSIRLGVRSLGRTKVDVQVFDRRIDR